MPKTGYHACCKKAGCGKKAVARKVPKSNLIKGAIRNKHRKRRAATIRRNAAGQFVAKPKGKLTIAQKMVLLQRKKRREARNKKK